MKLNIDQVSQGSIQPGLEFVCICVHTVKGISKQTAKNEAKIISHVNNKKGSTVVPEQVDREIQGSLFFVIEYKVR